MTEDNPEFNPYQPTEEQPQASGDHSMAASSIREIARWQTFFAVLLTIGVLMVMGMIALTSLSSQNAGAAIGSLLCMGGATLLIYGLPAIMLWKAAAAARDYSRSPSPNQLTRFASSQLTFWRTLGIIAALALGMYAVIFLGAMIFGISAAVG